MAGYSPLRIVGNSTGLVQEREEFILPDDAYPVLQNAYVWRERIKRKQGCQLLGRLQRNLVASSGGNINLVNPSPNTFNLFTLLGLTGQPNAEVIPGTTTAPIVIVIDAQTLTDNLGVGTFTIAPAGNITAATINYSTGVITITFTAPAGPLAVTITMSYSPGLPVMGIRIREQQNSANDQTVFFDQIYAYKFNGTTFQEFIPGTTWSGTNYNFFWSTNFWSTPSPGNLKLFWLTNYSGVTGDQIRYTDGITWKNFGAGSVPLVGRIDVLGNYLNQALCMLPFRGRLVAFNTVEGPTLATSGVFTNRIRWAAIGNPLIVDTLDGGTSVGSWRDDIRGKGGFLNIPTSEDIISVGFVRDNLVIYCENSTWQLKYTGRSIAPFQIEKVNSELGALGTFSAIQFDTSLVGIGDKGVVECDSYKSNLIDIKIPDLVFHFQHDNQGPSRVHGIRDFENRLAYWIFPSSPANGTFPDQRLIYNYENDSWALFNDSYTTLGTFQEPSSRTWLNTHVPWIRCNFPWVSQPLLIPSIVGGNQQGFIEQLDELTTNDESLSITAITSFTTTPTVITSPNHNLQTGAVIEIYDIPVGTSFDNLNFQPTLPYNIVFSIIVLTADTFQLMVYNPIDQEFNTPQLDTATGYVGGGKIAIRDNFNIQSKKFNFLDEGQSIQLGYLDILMDSTGNSSDTTGGAISLNIYLDYNTSLSSNTLPENDIDINSPLSIPDTFFNSIIPTTQSTLNSKGGTKFWQRSYCSTRANFLTLQYTFSNAQMASVEQTTDVQIDAQVLWLRKAGRMTQI